jgi:hypothetical protein
MQLPGQSADPGSYEQVFKALSVSQRGSYTDLSYMPVFRASAIFYAVCGAGINTCVGFLNYWREKNHVDGIGVMVTLRDAQGNKKLRQHSRLSAMTGLFNVREMLQSGGHKPDEFVGSIELEFFSAEDLKFQFPGVSVFYRTPGGVSYVHTNQRVYNHAEDKARGSALNAWQTGFDVLAGHGAFVFLVNGPVGYEGGSAQLVAIRADGECHSAVITLPAMAAYAVHNWQPGSVQGLVDFMGLEPGMCKLDLPLDGIHLRLGAGHAVGNGHSVTQWMTVTHSFFDATTTEDYFETSELANDVCPAFIPFVLPAHLNVTLVLYPIYSPCAMQLSLLGYSNDGTVQFSVDVGTYKTPSGGIRRLDIRDLLANAELPFDCSLYVLRFDPVGALHLPNRITYGLNFHYGERLGTNISASAYVARSWGKGQRSWKWGAVALGEGDVNEIMVCAFRNAGEAAGIAIALGTISIYDQQGIVASTQFSLKDGTARTFNAETLVAQSGCRATTDSILWYVVESSQAWLDVVGITVSAQGNVGGDHSF